MGGGNSKQAQLERYGYLLSRVERLALESTFHEIAGSQDATSLTEKQLTVSTHYTLDQVSTMLYTHTNRIF